MSGKEHRGKNKKKERELLSQKGKNAGITQCPKANRAWPREAIVGFKILWGVIACRNCNERKTLEPKTLFASKEKVRSENVRMGIPKGVPKHRSAKSGWLDRVHYLMGVCYCENQKKSWEPTRKIGTAERGSVPFQEKKGMRKGGGSKDVSGRGKRHNRPNQARLGMSLEK